MAEEYAVITPAQAQREHEALAKTKAAGRQHLAETWEGCVACRRRLKTNRVKVV